MTALSFEVLGSRAEPYAAVPTIMLSLRLRAPGGAEVHAVVLRCQIRIEPGRRGYRAVEEDRLYELFGETSRWGESLRSFLWTHSSMTVTGFRGSTEIELPIECTYDLEVTGTKYLHSLEDGDIPLVLLFSGTVFTRGTSGFGAQPIWWNEEASYRLPVSVWREMMDRYFPNSGWLRLGRQTLDDLQRFKASRALPTWDLAVEALLAEVREDQT